MIYELSCISDDKHIIKERGKKCEESKFYDGWDDKSHNSIDWEVLLPGHVCNRFFQSKTNIEAQNSCIMALLQMSIIP